MEKPDKHALECGYIPLGSPNQHPVGDPRKPNNEHFTTRQSRLHADYTTGTDFPLHDAADF
jgi:hypothetical protein